MVPCGWSLRAIFSKKKKLGSPLRFGGLLFFPKPFVRRRGGVGGGGVEKGGRFGVKRGEAGFNEGVRGVK